MFKDTFTRSKADETLSRETYTIPVVFIADGLVAIKLISKFPTFHPKYFSISNGQDLVITSSLNPEPFISRVLLENIKAYNTKFK